MAVPQTVLDYLHRLHVSFSLVDHPYAASTKELALVAHVDRAHIAKAVVLEDAHGPVCVVIPGDRWLRLHHVQAALGRHELCLADERHIERWFPDCDPGAVPPLGMAYGVETLVDEALWSLVKVYMESGDHRHLIVVSGEAFHRLMEGACRGHFSHGD